MSDVHNGEHLVESPTIDYALAPTEYLGKREGVARARHRAHVPVGLVVVGLPVFGPAHARMRPASSIHTVDTWAHGGVSPHGAMMVTGTSWGREGQDMMGAIMGDVVGSGFERRSRGSKEPNIFCGRIG